MSSALGSTHATYATMFNRKHDFSGHLWQARFYSCLLDEAHLYHAVRYVERNPVRAGIVRRAETYAWSSAAPHVHGIGDRYLDEGLPLVHTIRNWSEWLEKNDSEKAMHAVRTATGTGRACGSSEFIARIEAESGRSASAQRRGRKRQSEDEPELPS
jgi:putative transposase